jgi:DNA polymerase III epsilon subunit-like protein
MPRYLILDTETSALFLHTPKGAPPIPADDPRQPRLAGVTMIPVGTDLEPDGEAISTLIRPNGWEMSEGAGAVNGLTTERCEAEGVDVEQVLHAYTRFVRDEERIVVAFNAQFDTKQMRGELRRAGMDDLFEATPNICTMRGSMKLGVKKGGEKKGGFPKLSDVYFHFFEEEPSGQHTSLGDAEACLAIFRRLMTLGACPEPAVHYSSTRQDTPDGMIPVSEALRIDPDAAP